MIDHLLILLLNLHDLLVLSYHLKFFIKSLIHSVILYVALLTTLNYIQRTSDLSTSCLATN